MKIYAIFANDNQQGTTYQLFNKAIESLAELGHEIDILNLYDREKEIPFFKHDRAYMESHPFYLENKERFLNADQLLMVFPLFWYSVPGILKTWLDLINAWAYQYQSGPYAKAKHKIKHVLIIYAAMQDHKHMQATINNPVEQQLKETCKFIGIDDVDVYVVDNVTKITPSDLESHMQKVKTMCKK